MTFREKLADWLTCGEYSMRSDIIFTVDDDRRSYQIALKSIASIPVTPSSNGQTRKAVRIAKGALQE